MRFLNRNFWHKTDKKLKRFWHVLDMKMMRIFWRKKLNKFSKKNVQIYLTKNWTENESKMRENWTISDQNLNEIVWPKTDHFWVSFSLNLEKKSNFIFFVQISSNFSNSGSIRIRLISDRDPTKNWPETGRN